ADPKRDPLVLGNSGIAFGYPALHRNCACDRFDDARELDQDGVAGGLDNAALVLGNLRVDQFAAYGLEPRESADLILPHEAAVPCDIGREDCRQPALDPLTRHPCSSVGVAAVCAGSPNSSTAHRPSAVARDQPTSNGAVQL